MYSTWMGMGVNRGLAHSCLIVRDQETKNINIRRAAVYSHLTIVSDDMVDGVAYLGIIEYTL